MADGGFYFGEYSPLSLLELGGLTPILLVRERALMCFFLYNIQLINTLRTGRVFRHTICGENGYDIPKDLPILPSFFA